MMHLTGIVFSNTFEKICYFLMHYQKVSFYIWALVQILRKMSLRQTQYEQVDLKVVFNQFDGC